jgi:hypothetical protein
VRPLSGPQLNNHTSRLTALLRAPIRETNSAGHAYRICQPTNGRVGWPAAIQIKGGAPGWVRQSTVYAHTSSIKKEETLGLTPKGVICCRPEQTSDAQAISTAKDPAGRSAHTLPSGSERISGQHSVPATEQRSASRHSWPTHR